MCFRYSLRGGPDDVGVAKVAPLDVERAGDGARAAKDSRASCFCMGAAWRGPKERDLAAVLETVSAVQTLDLETCCPPGRMKDGPPERLTQAGLVHDNHKLDTPPEVYRDLGSTPDYPATG